MIDFKQILPARYSNRSPQRKRFVRLGCAALALALAVGSVPFLRGWAAEEEAAVSGSDIVSQSDTVVIARGTVEPKPVKSVIGGIGWQRMNSVDDLNNAALRSNSTVDSSMVSNWVKNYLNEFMAENGYTDATQLAFIYHYTDSWVGTSRMTQYGISTGETYLSNYADKILFYIPRVPATSVTLSHTRLDLDVGDAVTLTGELAPANTNDQIVWSSTDSTVVSIDKKTGALQAVGCGKATIKATVYNDVYEIPVTVSGQPYVDALNYEMSDWVLAESFDDLKNAAYFDKSNVASWYSRNSRKYPNRKWVYKYDPYEKKAYYRAIRSGEVTEDTFSSLTNLYYFPKPAASFTYHAAVEPTCTEAGSIAYWTDQDGNKFANANSETPLNNEAITVDALGHNWGAWTETTPATCESDGEETRTCARDASHTETRPIAATGHTWGEVTDTEPTCEEPGVKHEECSVCHEKRNEGTVIDALGHDWGAWTETTPATCTQPGEETRTCQRDASHTETRPIDALGHDWGAWTETTAPSCETAGEETRVCQNDPSHTETREVAALGHNWEWVTDTEATYEEAGEKHEECSVCHAKQKEHTAIPVKNAPVLEPVSGDHSQYTVGSQNGIIMKIDRKDMDDAVIYQHFLDAGSVVKVTGGNGYEKTLESGDFEASDGLLVIKLTASYLSTLAPGEYKLTATFLIDGTLFESAPASFTVSSPAPAGSDSPATGESIALILLCTVLPLFAAFGAVYALRRRRALGE